MSQKLSFLQFLPCFFLQIRCRTGRPSGGQSCVEDRRLEYAQNAQGNHQGSFWNGTFVQKS